MGAARKILSPKLGHPKQTDIKDKNERRSPINQYET